MELLQAHPRRRPMVCPHDPPPVGRGQGIMALPMRRRRLCRSGTSMDLVSPQADHCLRTHRRARMVWRAGCGSPLVDIPYGELHAYVMLADRQLFLSGKLGAGASRYPGIEWSFP